MYQDQIHCISNSTCIKHFCDYSALHILKFISTQLTIEYRSDDVTKTFFFVFQRFGYHVSVEHDEKHPQPKFGGNRFMGARDMAA